MDGAADSDAGGRRDRRGLSRWRAVPQLCRLYEGLFIDTQGDSVGVWLFASGAVPPRSRPRCCTCSRAFSAAGTTTGTVEHDAEEDLGEVLVGQPVTLRMDWQEREIRFRKDAEPPVTARFRREVAISCRAGAWKSVALPRTARTIRRRRRR